MYKKIINRTISVLFILLFLYTGITKLLEYKQFRTEIKSSPILKPFADWVSWFFPVIELMVAILLINNRWRLKGLYLSFILMLSFIGYLIVINITTYDIPCSCGGFLEQLPLEIHIIFNIVFAAFALIGIYLEKQVLK